MSSTRSAEQDAVRIELGASILESELIAQAATAAGMRVELLRNEHPELGGIVTLDNSAILVAAGNEADLRRMLAELWF